MTMYTKRQTKATLGIKELKGVSVANKPAGKKFSVKFRAEMDRDGKRLFGGTHDTSKDAAIAANKMFTNYYGTSRAAKSAGYWNTIS